MSNEYLNFKEISEKVSFIDLFNYLNISYSHKNDELRIKEGIFVNIKKNLYFNTKDDNQKGSVINFLANYKNIDLRCAAKELKDNFLTEESTPRKEIPELELYYSDFLEQNNISPELAKEYEVGLVKQRSIMSGKIAFRIRDVNSNPIGYIGYNIKDGSWFFPKGFKRPLYNAHRLTDSPEIFLVINPLDVLKIVSYGFPFVGGLLGKSINDGQIQTLKELNNIRIIYLIHPESENIVVRLSQFKFVRCNSQIIFEELSKEKFINMIKNP